MMTLPNLTLSISPGLISPDLPSPDLPSPDPATPTSPTSPGLHFFPAEIRDKIFSEVLTYDGNHPELLKVLRVDPKLHQEAVHVYQKQNTKVTLNFANEWSLAGMSAKTLQHARIFQIDLDHEIGEHENLDFANLAKLEETTSGLRSLKLPVVDLIIREVRKPSAELWDDDQWMDGIVDTLIRVVMDFYLGCESIRSVTHVTYQDATRVNDIQDFMMEDLGEEGQVNSSTTSEETVLRWDIKPEVLEEIVETAESELARLAAATSTT